MATGYGNPPSSRDTYYGTNPAGEGSQFNDGDTGPGEEPANPGSLPPSTPDRSTGPMAGRSDEVHVGSAMGGDKAD